MNRPPRWFTATAALALLWNLAGLAAAVADLQLSAADIAAMPPEQQALYAARPAWSVLATVIAVVGGTLGCVGLLLRKRWALWALYVSLAGVVVQDLGIFVVVGPSAVPGVVPFVLQGVVFIVAVALVLLARRAATRAWLT